MENVVTLDPRHSTEDQVAPWHLLKIDGDTLYPGAGLERLYENWRGECLTDLVHSVRGPLPTARLCT